MLEPRHTVPRSTAAWGIALFVLSLAILFGASMIGYFWIRIQHSGDVAVGSLHLPGLLWLSTAVIVASSFSVGSALTAVRRQRLQRFRRNLVITFALALLFIGLQTPALIQLLHEHFGLGIKLYGIVFFLVLLHAAHVIGGMIFLAIVLYGAAHDAYDHEHYMGVRNLAVYWHFLDVVWLVMFFSLWGVG